MAIEIEKNVEIPKNMLRRGRHPKYPFRNMEVGDSFFVAGGEKEQKRIATSACQFKRRNNGFTFTTRKVEGGVRCWRVEEEEETK